MGVLQHGYWQMHTLPWGLIIWVRAAKGPDPIQFSSLPALLLLWCCLGSRCCTRSWVCTTHSVWPAPLTQEVPKSKGQGGAGLNYLFEQRDTAKCMSRFKQNLCFQAVLPLLGSVWHMGRAGPSPTKCLSLENWTMQSCHQEIISTQLHHACSVCFLFEEHKKSCKNSSLHSPCWLTVGIHAPSILLNHRALGRFIFGDTIFFLQDKALCYQPLPAWACRSLTVYLTKGAEGDEAPNICSQDAHPEHSGSALEEDTELPAHNNSVWWKWQQRPCWPPSSSQWVHLNAQVSPAVLVSCARDGALPPEWDGPSVAEWKTFLVISWQQQKRRSHFRAWMAGGGERTPFPGIHRDFVVIVQCTEASGQRGFHGSHRALGLAQSSVWLHQGSSTYVCAGRTHIF